MSHWQGTQGMQDLRDTWQSSQDENKTDKDESDTEISSGWEKGAAAGGSVTLESTTQRGETLSMGLISLGQDH